MHAQPFSARLIQDPYIDASTDMTLLPQRRRMMRRAAHDPPVTAEVLRRTPPPRILGAEAQTWESQMPRERAAEEGEEVVGKRTLRAVVGAEASQFDMFEQVIAAGL